jgi:hypothetical protein
MEQLYLWLIDNLPIPYEIRQLYEQHGYALTIDQAQFIEYQFRVKSSGPGGRGFQYFAQTLTENQIFPPQFIPENKIN